MKRILIAVSALMLLVAANLSASASYPTGTTASVESKGTTQGVSQTERPKTYPAAKSDRSIPLRDIVPMLPLSGPERDHFSNLDRGHASSNTGIADSLVHGAISPPCDAHAYSEL